MSFFAKLLAGFAALVLAANVAGHGSGSPQPPGPGGPANTVVQNATMALLNLNTQYGNAAPSARGPLLAQLIAAAQDRHNALAALMETDPAQVLQAALPANLLGNFPGQAAAFLEQDALVDGTLEVYHVDYPDASAEYLYILNTTTGRLSLYFAGKAPALLTGTTVRVHGVKVDNALALSSDTGSVQTLAPAALPNTLGPQKTLTILVNFTDEATQPYTVAYAQSMMFTTTTNYWNETSYQQTTVVGDVAGWFTIPVSSTTCDYSSIASYAKTAASNAGFVVSNYTRQVYVFPAN